MQTGFATADPAEMLEGALGRLREQEASSLVVLEGGRLIGILTPENVGEFIMMNGAMRGRRAKDSRPSAHDERPPTRINNNA